MNLVRWKFEDVDVLIIEREKGALFITDNMLAKLLGITEAQMCETYETAYKQYKRHFDNISTDADMLHILKANSGALEIENVGPETRIWTENDIDAMAVLSRSARGRLLRKSLTNLIKIRYQKSLGVVSAMY